jgi:hypothetical protein
MNNMNTKHEQIKIPARIELEKNAFQKARMLDLFSQQVSLNLSLKLPVTYYELWRGFLAKNGIRDDFLEFLMSRSFVQIIEESDLGLAE